MIRYVRNLIPSLTDFDRNMVNLIMITILTFYFVSNWVEIIPQTE